MKSSFDLIVDGMVTVLAGNLGLHAVELPPFEGYELRVIEGTSAPEATDVRVYVRDEDRHRNDCPPSVCCVPRGGDILPPDQIGSYKRDGVSYRSIRDRVFGIDTYVWGADRGQAEALYGQVLLGFETYHNMVQFSAESWEDQIDGNGGQLTYGALISFRTTVRIAVTDLPTRLSRVHRVTANVTMLGATETIHVPKDP